MATTQEKQRLASLRRKAERLATSRLEINTTNWVDERYASQLTNQLRGRIKSSLVEERIWHLNQIRKSFSFITEEQTSTGYTVWVLDIDIDPCSDRFVIAPFQYCKKGKIKPIVPEDIIYISAHAMIRIFERLRTNSTSDIKSIIKALSALGDPSKFVRYKEFEVKVLGGTFYAVRNAVAFELVQSDGFKMVANDKDNPSLTPIWVIKTFIADKK